MSGHAEHQHIAAQAIVKCTRVWACLLNMLFGCLLLRIWFCYCKVTIRDGHPAQPGNGFLQPASLDPGFQLINSLLTFVNLHMS